jgi:RNA polymerase sigma factor (sigma-70 family)
VADRRTNLERKEDSATPADFERLLSLFDPDPTLAVEKYETMRLKLRSFFLWRGGEDPDGLVDETIDRVLGRIREGGVIHSPSSYFYSVARHLVREDSEKRLRLKRAIENDPHTRYLYDPLEAALELENREDQEKKISRLKSCLNRLPQSDRDLILKYYTHGETGKISSRKTLADALGIPLNALRIRVFRIRARLGKWLDSEE